MTSFHEPDLKMAAEKMFNPPASFSDANCSSMEQYREMHEKSVNKPAEFWGEIAKQFYWKQPPNPDQFLDYNFDCSKGPIYIKWMQGGITNVCYNVLDRNVKEKGLGEKIAFYWEGNDPDDCSKMTFKELLDETCKFANVLKSKGVKKGDKVAIYLPMIHEAVAAMLACARIGAIHSIVFGGFSATSLADRILDASCKVLVTADGCWRGTKLLDLKKISDAAMQICSEKDHNLETCVVVRHLSADGDSVNGAGDQANDVVGKRPVKNMKYLTCCLSGLHVVGSEHNDWDQSERTQVKNIRVEMKEGRDFWYQDLMRDSSPECEPEWLDSEDPLFMLYTSGSTGKPKGVLHTQAGYMLYTATTFKYSFDYHEDDVYWCTADVGWITGHSYITYGPLANGATGIIFEGTPFHPGPDRCWEVVDKYKVTKFYTAPTAIRALMKFGDALVKKHSRQSLKVLGTVGEPINPEAWLWYYNVVGDGRCAVVDTFWQTETGGHVVTPLPGATPTKPGSATFPFFGVVPELLTEEGKLIEGVGEGYLVFKQPWPGIMRTVYGNHERFETTYFKKFPGYYTTGDGARRDKDGYLWITGRIDDMLNVSGHLLSTAEVESALIEHPSVAETAVVAHPHEVKGECLYCFITLREGHEFSETLATDLKTLVRKNIGPFAQPDFMQEAPGLPKTRSGKIMRRVLRKIAVGDRDLGDVTTMADESVVDVLFSLRPKNA